MKATAALFIALAICAGALFIIKFENNKQRVDTSTTATDPVAASAENKLGYTQVEPSSNISPTPDLQSTDQATARENKSGERHTSLDNSATDQDSIDIFALGNMPLDNVKFRYWVSRLRSNPQLLQSALTEYLENSDTIRARNLAAILAEVNSPLVLDAATQLANSTNTTEQLNGLELLARLQPINTHARNKALDLLATQVDPTLLVATLNVFATTAQVVSPEQRQLLLDHAQILSTHEDANVRAMSISTISKWSRGHSDTAATIGLSDTDAAVRAKAAASLIGVQNASPQATQSLLFVAADKSETKTTRQLALYALSKMQLSESDRMHYEALEVEVRRTRH